MTTLSEYLFGRPATKRDDVTIHHYKWPFKLDSVWPDYGMDTWKSLFWALYGPSPQAIFQNVPQLSIWVRMLSWGSLELHRKNSNFPRKCQHGIGHDSLHLALKSPWGQSVLGLPLIRPPLVPVRVSWLKKWTPSILGPVKVFPLHGTMWHW